MNLRTALAAALGCAAVLTFGCTANNVVENADTAAAEADENRFGPMESHRADAKFDPSARHFDHFSLGWSQYGRTPVLATQIHRNYVEDFLRHPGAGFGRMGTPGPLVATNWTELVPVSAGERSLGVDHAGDGPIGYDDVSETLTLGDGTRAERRERVWHLDDKELVSVNAATGPAVYLNSPKKQHELMEPKLDGATAPKRPLDGFEKEALDKLRAGDEVVLQSSKRELRMMGAIRAWKSCLACHKVKEDTLLGAFTYTLKAQSEATPEPHRLKDTAGLTDQRLWAVRSIEALGGKVIRAPGGPVTEVRMSFSRNLEDEGNPEVSSTRLLLRDSALPHLLAFPDLTVLDVSRSLVSDAGLKTIAELRNLKRLDIRECRTTEVGISELRKSLPKCEITTDPMTP